MNIKPKDIAILAAVIVAAVALVMFSTRQYGGNAPQEKPQLVGKSSETVPINAATGKALEVPNESAL